MMIQYLNNPKSDIGTNAVVGLAMIDYLRTVQVVHKDGESNHQKNFGEFATLVRTKLRPLMNFLKYMQLSDNKHF